ncbi:hypothetical protein RclHR1_20240003 [Rhizophagus clarus]|uniref:DNA-directed DNA polymerase n=1 Tax=Rhizophagus clarus TaxID=94130 RepID=A0A2Z6QT09_9GLOM|nr:hypothetical protein RclHR1_20240003 [Rhizophagus clarus]
MEFLMPLFMKKKLKFEAVQVAKRILNTLWGALCQRKKTYKILTASSKSFDFPDGEVLDSIITIGEEQWRFQFTNSGNPFKGGYPRIAPFLLAHGQKFISETVQPYVDKVRRIHTDGFVLEEDVNNSPLYTCSKDAFKILKTLKFEKEGVCSNRKMEHDSFPFTNKHPSFIKPEMYLATIIEKIESANNPEGYIHYTAKKLLPNKESHAEKVIKIQAKYPHNPDIAFRIIKVYDLYNHIPKEVPPRHKLTEDEAEDILAELLSNES